MSYLRSAPARLTSPFRKAAASIKEDFRLRPGVAWTLTAIVVYYTADAIIKYLL